MTVNESNSEDLDDPDDRPAEKFLNEAEKNDRRSGGPQKEPQNGKRTDHMIPVTNGCLSDEGAEDESKDSSNTTDDKSLLMRISNGICASVSLRQYIEGLSKPEIYDRIMKQPINNTAVSVTSSIDFLRESLVFALSESVRTHSIEEAKLLICAVVQIDETGLVDSLLKPSPDETQDHNTLWYKTAYSSFLRSRMRAARQELHKPMIESAHRFHGTIPDCIDPLPPSARDLDNPSQEKQHVALPLLTKPRNGEDEILEERRAMNDNRATSLNNREDGTHMKSYKPYSRKARLFGRFLHGSNSNQSAHAAADSESCSSSISSDGSRSSESRKAYHRVKNRNGPASPIHHKRRGGHHTKGRSHKRCSHSNRQSQRHHSSRKNKKMVQRGFLSLLLSKLSLSLDGLSNKFHKKPQEEKIRGILKRSNCNSSSACSKSVRFGYCNMIDLAGAISRRPIFSEEIQQDEIEQFNGNLEEQQSSSQVPSTAVAAEQEIVVDSSQVCVA